jgi:hypothetical protein
MDPEEIGALLDGAAAGERRDALLARLAAAGDDYDLFADTAAVLRELEEGAAAAPPADEPDDEPAAEEPTDDPQVIPLRPATPVAAAPVAAAPADDAQVIPLRPNRRSLWRHPAVQGLAAAAVLAAVVVPLYRSRAGGGDWRDPTHLASLTLGGTALPAGWTDTVPWQRTTRGGSDAGVPVTAASARLGAWSTDLVVAVRSGDHAATPRLAAQIVSTLQNVPAGSLLETSYRMIADSAHWPRPKVLKKVDEAYTDLSTAAEPDYLAVGAWAEAGRLAARSEDAAFFRTPESSRALEAAAALDALDERSRAAIGRLRNLQSQAAVDDWQVVRRDLDLLLATAAR